MTATTKRRWLYVLGGIALAMLVAVGLIRMINHHINRQYGEG